MKKDLFKVLNRTKWKIYKFGDIAKSINEKVNPTKTDLDIYVGLEHLDTETIHIKRFGKKDDVKGAKLRCYPGDIIFGRRRAYQRKASTVTFDGFCSAHSLVLRANPNVIDPQIFPFFLHSDLFMHRAVDISVGSLSPTINWGSLKEQEFLLPPKEEQTKLAKLLWAADNVVEKDKELLEKLEVGKKVKFIANNKHLKLKSLNTVSEVFYGLGQPPALDENGVAMIRATNIKRGKIFTKDLMRIDKSKIPSGKNVFLREGDIIVVRSGAYTGDAALITHEWEGSIAGYDLVLRVDKNKVNPTWLIEFILDSTNQKFFKGESIRSAQPHLNSSQLLNTLIPDLKLEHQDQIANLLNNYHRSIEKSKSKLQSSQALLKALINEIFGG